MSDKPTPKPQSGRSVIQHKAKHEKPGYGGSVKQTSPGITTKPFPKKGKECALQKSTARDEARFNRGATSNWNKSRPHIEANKSLNDPMNVPDPVTPSKVKPPPCQQSYDGKPIQ